MLTPLLVEWKAKMAKLYVIPYSDLHADIEIPHQNVNTNTRYMKQRIYDFHRASDTEHSSNH